MNPNPQPGHCEEVTAEDYAAIDKVLRKIDQENTRGAALARFAYWKLGFHLYRDVELQFECAADRAPFQNAHRAMLTGMMAATEQLEMALDSLPDPDLNRIGLSKSTFRGCADYLRRKYRQWYVPIEPKVIELFESSLSGR